MVQVTGRTWRKIFVAAASGVAFAFSALGAYQCAVADPVATVLSAVLLGTAVLIAVAFGLDGTDKQTWFTKIFKPIVAWLTKGWGQTVFAIFVSIALGMGSYYVFWKALTKAEVHCSVGSKVSWDRLFGSKGEMPCDKQCSPEIWHPFHPSQTENLLWLADGKSKRTWLKQGSDGFYECAPQPADAHVECAEFQRIGNKATSPKCGGRLLARYRLNCSLNGKVPKSARFEITADEGAYIVFHEPMEPTEGVFKAEEKSSVMNDPRFGSFVNAVMLTVALDPNSADKASYYLELCGSAPRSELHVQENGK